jgi:cytosine/adenosine deaminase-related metal-dependent hydrolase
MNPPLRLLHDQGCVITLGTDSYASTDSLSILEEMKTIQQVYNNQFPIEALLQWATVNGAKALQVDNKLGSFGKGMQPGVVVIENISEGQNLTHAVSRRII